MAIGALGIKNMVKNGGILTICIAVSLTVLECFLMDRTTLPELAGHIASDLVKIGLSAVMGGIFGLAAGGFVAYASVPIGVAIVISLAAGYTFNLIDNKYHLTEKLISVLEETENNANSLKYEAQSTMYKGLWNVLRSSGLRGKLY